MRLTTTIILAIFLTIDASCNINIQLERFLHEHLHWEKKSSSSLI